MLQVLQVLQHVQGSRLLPWKSKLPILRQVLPLQDDLLIRLTIVDLDCCDCCLLNVITKYNLHKELTLILQHTDPSERTLAAKAIRPMFIDSFIDSLIRVT